MNKDCQKIDIGHRIHFNVRLRWEGGVDLDLSAFMLNKDGFIDNESDLVFYNSTNRSESYDAERFANEEDWISKTIPVSTDASLIGAADAEGVIDSCSMETMSLDLHGVGENINKIVFCVSIFQSKLHPKDRYGKLRSEVSLIDSDTGEILSSYDLDELDGIATSAETYEFERIAGGWGCRLCGVTHDSGLHSIIDKYV